MIYLAILFTLLVLLAMGIVFLFTMLKASLNSVRKFILKQVGKPCPFCQNQYSLVHEKTSDGHKQVCKRCGFSVIVEDTESYNESSEASKNTNSSYNNNDNKA